eukprot:3126922-Prymnesium_polylepis.1
MTPLSAPGAEAGAMPLCHWSAPGAMPHAPLSMACAVEYSSMPCATCTFEHGLRPRVCHILALASSHRPSSCQPTRPRPRHC